jgi:hypothetical protein
MTGLQSRIQRLRAIAASPTVTESETHDILSVCQLMTALDAWHNAPNYHARHAAHEHLRGLLNRQNVPVEVPA